MRDRGKEEEEKKERRRRRTSESGQVSLSCWLVGAAAGHLLLPVRYSFSFRLVGASEDSGIRTTAMLDATVMMVCRTALLHPCLPFPLSSSVHLEPVLSMLFTCF